MEQFKITEFNGTKVIRLTYNGQKYDVAYDQYDADYDIWRDDKRLSGPFGRYYIGDAKSMEEFFRSTLFKDEFISEIMYYELKDYGLHLFKYRKGNEYVLADGIFKNNVRNCKGSLYHNGKYWYLEVGADGYPTVEKSFATFEAIRDYVAKTCKEKEKSGKKDGSSKSKGSVQDLVVGLSVAGGVLVAKEIYDVIVGKKDK